MYGRQQSLNNVSISETSNNVKYKKPDNSPPTKTIGWLPKQDENAVKG